MAKILIVDDSSLSRRMLIKILTTVGHQMVEAKDGMAALETYFIEKPDIVLLDMLMSGMDGIEVLGKLREMDPQATIIVATADIQTSTREMVKAAGANGFITKPFTDEQVVSAVNAVLQGGNN